MKLTELIDIIKADLYRYENNIGLGVFLRYVLFTPGFKYTFKLRVYKYILSKRISNKFRVLFTYKLKRVTYKYGIQIPIETNVGKGILIRHFGGIFVNPDCYIGDNLTISQGVTIGINNGGVPTIGNNVYRAPGAKVIGKINIGNNVVIGVNAVVTKDIPDNAVVAGNPMKILYYKDN